jgi:hypothetical protein
MAFGGHPAGADTPTATITLAGNELSPSGEYIYRVIRRYFPDAPYMVYIANCESTGLIHWAESGELRRNMEGGSARGVLQVLMRVHGPIMRAQNLDPNQLDDYMKYVRKLYDLYGVRPWNASRHCWGEYYRRFS